MEPEKIVFVTGATGRQGGAVARYLSQSGFRVKALSRKPNSQKAESLKEFDIEVVQGDLNHVDSYRSYLKDAYGVFSVQTYENGIGRELDQGIALAKAAKEADIKHFVYSSVILLDLHEGIPHLETKFKIENYVRENGIPYTILRPASFFENFLIPQVRKGIIKGKLVQPIEQNTVMQYVSVIDIGKAAAQIFRGGGQYHGKIIPITNEQLTTQQVADLFSEVLQKPVRYEKLPGLIARLVLGKSVHTMFKRLDKINFFKEETVAASKSQFTGMLSLKEWISSNFT